MKNQTLKQNKDFRRLYYRGKCCATGTVIVYAQKSKRNLSRTGITTSKKIGNAVKRNRSRRVIRTAYFELVPMIEGNWDFVFVARSRTGEVKMQKVLEDMKKAFLQLGVINEENQ